MVYRQPKSRQCPNVWYQKTFNNLKKEKDCILYPTDQKDLPITSLRSSASSSVTDIWRLLVVDWQIHNILLSEVSQLIGFICIHPVAELAW